MARQLQDKICEKQTLVHTHHFKEPKMRRVVLTYLAPESSLGLHSAYSQFVFCMFLAAKQDAHGTAASSYDAFGWMRKRGTPLGGHSPSEQRPPLPGACAEHNLPPWVWGIRKDLARPTVPFMYPPSPSFYLPLIHFLKNKNVHLVDASYMHSDTSLTRLVKNTTGQGKWWV